MNWVTVIWSMTAAACITLGLINGMIWWRQKSRVATLFFTLTAIGTAAYAQCELACMHSQTADQIAAMIRWTHVPVCLVFISMAGFVYYYFRAGRVWLAWTACSLRALSLILNFSTGVNINYRQITRVSHSTLFGEPILIAQGIPNPWMLVGHLSLLVLLIYIADAAFAVWQRGEREKAVWVGGSIILFIVATAVQSMTVFWGWVDGPIIGSLFYLGIVVAMSYEIGREAIRASELQGELHESEKRTSLAQGAAHRAEEEIQSHRKTAAHLLRVVTLGELSSALAHELNQPLMAILSNAQAAQKMLAQSNPDTNEIRNILQDIVVDDMRAGEVIRRLRTLLKKGEVNPQPLEMNELVQDVLKLMKGTLNARQINVVTDFSPSELKVNGDSVQLQQVLINLILNAAAAMDTTDAKARTLTLRTMRVAGDQIQISVADTGGGFAPFTEEKIFEAYYTTKPDGLGLGLSLNRSILSMHGGRLWASNRAEGGALFCFTLPELN